VKALRPTPSRKLCLVTNLAGEAGRGRASIGRVRESAETLNDLRCGDVIDKADPGVGDRAGTQAGFRRDGEGAEYVVDLDWEARTELDATKLSGMVR
jgi:hypothetical protein